MNSIIKRINKVAGAILMLTLSIFASLNAQIPANLIGSSPSGLKWSQINTDRVKVIFPKGSDEQAKRIANIVHFLWDEDLQSIGNEKHKVPILLYNQTVLPNGLVTVGPFRSEFFATPPQFSNATDWLDELTIHEYRHVQQFGNATKGITKTVKKVLGSWAWGGMMATALPRWYFEGDAVVAESAYTHTGRGRLPAFNMEYHSLFEAGYNYSYEKAGAGSLKYFVPNWYRLGYNMISYGRDHFGEDLWEKVADDAVRYRGLFYPFNKSLKKRTGLGTKMLYAETMKRLQSNWQAKLAQQGTIQGTTINSLNKKQVTNFTNPIALLSTDVIAFRSSYDRYSSIVRLTKGGNEEVLTEHGVLIGAPHSTLSASKNLLCWAELGFDPRWRYRQFSEVMTFNMSTREKKRISLKTRYFSPDLSPNADRIVAVHIDEQQKQNLRIISSHTGEVLLDISNEEDYMLTFPKWVDEESIVFVASKHEQSHIRKYDFRTETSVAISKQSISQISHLFPFEGKVFFSGAYTGINNIFSVNTGSGDIEQLTNESLGAFHPSISPDGVLLLYSRFSAKGYNIVSVEMASIDPVSLEKTDYTKAYDYDALSERPGKSILDEVPNEDFEISKFNKFSGILNPHSLTVEISDPIAGINLLSDNVFGTLSGQASAFYNYNEDEWTYGVGLNYAELYPIINASFAHANRSSILLNIGGLTDTSFIQTVYAASWSENRFSAGFTLPYNFSKGNMSNQMRLRANYQHATLNVEDRFNDPVASVRDTVVFSPSNKQSIEAIYDGPLDNGKLSTLDLSFSIQMIKRPARLHVNRRLGFSLFARVRRRLGGSEISGDVTNFGGTIFLPGLGPNHSFYVNSSYQNEKILDNYRYSDQFNYARGYDITLRRDKFLKIGFNYAFPIVYPDAALGGFAFLKRLKSTLFFDYSRIDISSFPFRETSTNMNSLGVELGFDFRAFRLVEVDMGLRYSYLLNEALAPGGNRHQFNFFVISITQ